MKAIAVILGALLLVGFGCGTASGTISAPNGPGPTASKQAPGGGGTESGVVGRSASCDKPPATIELSGRSYRLNAEKAQAEPGNKIAWLKCEKGTFTLGDADNPYTVYRVGNPASYSDIMITGNWGGTGVWSQSVYTPAAEAETKR